MPRLFVTGAGGYVGRRLLRKLDPSQFDRVVCLARRPNELADYVRGFPHVEILPGDLTSPDSFRRRLDPMSLVVHLAAVTGKTSRADSFRVNADGTRALVEAAQSAGVRRFLHISSIAVKFPDQYRYFYAHAKRMADDAVSASGLAYTIVRPTMIVGPGSPLLAGISRLAAGAAVLVFGNGRARVQPVFVDDLVDVLVDILRQARFGGETIEVGGPDVMSIQEFLLMIRRIRYGKPPRVWHLPLGLVRAAVGLIERVALPLVPLTAGQLASFANDGLADPHPLVDARRSHMKHVAEVLEMNAFEG